MRISSRANVKALIFSLLCVELKALIASNTIEVGSFSLVPFAWFAYKSHGKYTIEVTSSREGEKLRLLLLVVASQNSCKTIGKPCVYEIPEIPDICTDMNATELNNKIIGAHPIIIPSYSYVFKRNTSNSRVSVESWNEYAALSNTPLKPFIENILMPGVVNASLLHYLEFTNFLEGDESSAQEIITEIDGDVHGTSYVYFSVLNCYKEPLSLSLKYEFSNPGGEQLSSTDTPQKHIHLVLACCFGVLGAATSVAAIIEKVQRDKLRLLHILIAAMVVLVITECLVQHVYWNKMSAEGSIHSPILTLRKIFVLVNEFACLALVYFVASGITILPGVFSAKSYIPVSLFVLAYIVYVILYLMYGSIVQFIIGIMGLGLLVRVCRMTSFAASRIASAMHDLRFSRQALQVPRRKLRAVVLVRRATLILVVLLIVGSLMASVLFSSYFWISEIYNKSIKLVYLFVVLYVFRCTRTNVALYEPMPCVQQTSEELNWREVATDEMPGIDCWYLVTAPGDNFYLGKKK